MSTQMPVALDKIYDKQEFALGQKVDVGSKAFRFVKYLDGETAVTGAAGLGVFGIRENRWHVTADYDSTTTNCNTVLGKHKGYLQAALTDGKFGFIQTNGPNRKASTLTASTTAAGANVIAAQAGNGTGTAVAFGMTQQADYRVGKIERATLTPAANTVAAGKFLIELE